MVALRLTGLSRSGSMPPYHWSTWRHLIAPDQHEAEDVARVKTHWSQPRRRFHRWLNHKAFEVLIGALIVANLVVTIFETDATADGQAMPVGFAVANGLILCTFALELVLKLYVYRAVFFWDEANIADVLIVSADVVIFVLRVWVEDLPSLSALRVFHCVVRLSRALRFAIFFEELYTMLQGLRKAFKAIFWGVFLLGLMLILWSILAVHIIHPVSTRLAEDGACYRCTASYSSVWQSCMTLFGFAVYGDGWEALAIPIMREMPLTGVFYAGVVITMNFATMNILLSIIVQHAEEAMEHTMHLNALEVDDKIRKAKEKLLRLCEMIDHNEDGCITKDELKEAFQKKDEFSFALREMGAHKEDVEMVFRILEEGQEDHIRYEDVAEEIHRMQAQGIGSLESRLTLSQVTKIHECVRENRRLLQGEPVPVTRASGRLLSRAATAAPWLGSGARGLLKPAVPATGSCNGTEALSQREADLVQAMEETARRMEAHIKTMRAGGRHGPPSHGPGGSLLAAAPGRYGLRGMALPGMVPEAGSVADTDGGPATKSMSLPADVPARHGLPSDGPDGSLLAAAPGRTGLREMVLPGMIPEASSVADTDDCFVTKSISLPPDVSARRTEGGDTELEEVQAAPMPFQEDVQDHTRALLDA